MTQHDSADIPEAVRRVVAETLRLPLDKVELDSNLMTDLAVESIDLLDIVFRLEAAFDVEITRGAIEAAARGNMSDDEFAPDGIISERGLARLRELMPESSTRIQPGLRPGQIPQLFTVRTFAKIVQAMLSASSA
jgi:acyl carrier protein